MPDIPAWKLCTNSKWSFLESVEHLGIGHVFIRNGSCPKTKFRLWYTVQGASIASMDFRSIIMMRRTNVFWKREKIVLASWHRKKWPLLVIISMYEQTDPAYFVSHLLSCIWWPICWSSKGLSIDSLGTGMLCRFGPKSDISIMKISFYQRKEEPHKTLHCFSDSKL